MRATRLVVLLTLFAPSVIGATRSRPEHRMVIDKSSRRLTVYIGGRAVRTFRVGLGRRPTGDKVRQGDTRTPEGRFFVGWKKKNSDFHRFLGLSYPMPRHARRALGEGRIDRRLVRRIERAVRKRRPPPQTTPLGGYVGIHGGGAGADWTLGCIAVADEEVAWLFERFEVGDVVEVKP